MALMHLGRQDGGYKVGKMWERFRKDLGFPFPCCEILHNPGMHHHHQSGRGIENCNQSLPLEITYWHSEIKVNNLKVNYELVLALERHPVTRDLFHLNRQR